MFKDRKYSGSTERKPYAKKSFSDKPKREESTGDRPERRPSPFTKDILSSASTDRPQRRSFGDKPAERSSSSRPYGTDSSRGGYRGGSSSASSRGSFGKPRRFGNDRGGSSSRGGFRSERPSGGRPSFNTRKFANLPIEFFIQKAVKDEIEFVPTYKYADLNINAKLKENILKRGFEFPTPIQDSAIKEVLAGKDVIGVADTGSGKTGAFLIPILDRISKNPRERVLIMAPTRELALQIDEEFRLLSKMMNIYSVVCIGGVNIRPQMYQLRKPHNLLIGTPGRIKDLEDRRCIDLPTYTMVVLDEVDRMLDMGFVDDMKYLLGKLPEKRQTLFFTATLDKDVEPIAFTFTKNPEVIKLKKRDTSKNVHQDVVKVERHEDRLDKLSELLGKPEFFKVLIFVRSKIGADKLESTLRREGFNVVSIHGDKPQGKRQQALRLFKTDKASIMIATDIAARGLDVPNVSHVINYDKPATHDDYIHRIGRTGRGNNTGNALTFI